MTSSETETNPKTFFFAEHFKASATAKEYDLTIGGVTLAVAQRILQHYLDGGNTLKGKVILDNACGTGVVTKEALRVSRGDIRVEAADLSEAMVGCLREELENEELEGKVGLSVMDAQV